MRRMKRFCSPSLRLNTSTGACASAAAIQPRENGPPVGGRGHGKVAHGAQTNDNTTALHGCGSEVTAAITRPSRSRWAEWSLSSTCIVIKGPGRRSQHQPWPPQTRWPANRHSHPPRYAARRPGQAQSAGASASLERHLLGGVAAAPARPRWARQERCAANQHLAHALLQLLDALRYGGARHMQRRQRARSCLHARPPRRRPAGLSRCHSSFSQRLVRKFSWRNDRTA